MNVDFKNFIKEMFRSMGGEILERDDDYIWVRTDEEVDIFKIVLNTPVTEADVISFHRATEQVNANKIILCTKETSNATKEMAKKLNIAIIDRKPLSYMVGDYVVSALENNENLPILEDVGDKEEPEEEILDENTEEEATEEDEDMDTIPIILEDTSDSSEKVIKLRVNRIDALQMAGKIIGDARIELNLVPYHLFDYSLRIIIEGDTKERSASGIIAVNGISGEYEIWKEGYETETSTKYAELREEPVISLADAKKIAREGLIEEYTAEKEVIEENAHVTIIEKRKTRPLENSITISHLGLYYLPVWIASNGQGKLWINAANGTIIKKELRKNLTF